MKNRTLHFACISVLFWMSHSSNAATPEINTNTIEKSSVHDKFHRTLILSGFCLLKIAKISL
ncbi:hypothetical protein, partial [Acinetobacter baumannii]|uniref:hypothetical protein n=1 Tax=Acinetobacter baumannii TaxID=470 RepID=UPI001BCC8649